MNFQHIRPILHQMEYRRFGKTEKQVSVITLGGMRFTQAGHGPRHELPKATIDQCRDTVIKAFNQGINLIETAYGYNRSESVYGHVLNDELKIQRERYFLMTKGNSKTAAQMRALVEEQLKTLKTDYFDFYAWHGINNQSLLEQACAPGGPVEELLKMKAEGLIHHVGFSTHAPVEIIEKAIETNLFDFVNLHYYYFFQRNISAIEKAQARDMGVFIISPNDKGGQLFNPPEQLVSLTSPLHPLQWNARFCLSHPGVHTLSFGLPATASFELLDGIFPAPAPLAAQDAAIKDKMDFRRQLDPYADFDASCLQNDPSGINIPEVLRFRMLWKCYGMIDFGRYRYNMLEEKGHWFPGYFATDERIAQIDTSKCPSNIPLADLLRETHRELYIPKRKE